jgi:hypothetical protein
MSRPALKIRGRDRICPCSPWIYGRDGDQRRGATESPQRLEEMSIDRADQERDYVAATSAKSIET